MINCETCNKPIKIETVITVSDVLSGTTKVFDKRECVAKAYGATSDPLDLTLEQLMSLTRQKAAMIKSSLVHGTRSPVTGACRLCDTLEGDSHKENCLFRNLLTALGTP